MDKNQAATGLCHVAIRTRNILESIRFYTDILGLPEAFRMHGEDGSLATVYISWHPDSIWSCSPTGGKKPLVIRSQSASAISA